MDVPASTSQNLSCLCIRCNALISRSIEVYVKHLLEILALAALRAWENPISRTWGLKISSSPLYYSSKKSLHKPHLDLETIT